MDVFKFNSPEHRLMVTPRLGSRVLFSLLSVAALAGPLPAADDLQTQLQEVPLGGTVSFSPGTVKVPLTIDRSLTLRGDSPETCVVEVTANEPALSIRAKEPVIVEGLTFRWQLASSDDPQGPACALLIRDSPVTLRNCRFMAPAGPQRCPAAVQCAGFSKVAIENCCFEGFNFTVNYLGGAEGNVADCTFVKPGHCGLTVLSGSTVDVSDTVVTGSDYHALRCTGGTLNAHDNLIVSNKNRGVYLGNKSAKGRIWNNVIQGNGTGISAFAQSEVTIENNVIRDNSYAAIDSRDTCPLTIRNNILAGNTRGFVLFGEAGRSQLNFSRNTFWKNDTDAENVDPAEDSIRAEPQFAAPDEGDFNIQSAEVKAANQGLTDAAAIREVWKQWEKLRSEANE